MRSAFLLIIILVAMPAATQANPESVKRRAAAYKLAYNLDYDEATREMEAAAKADPRDAAAERGLAVIPWLLISYTRGAACVDEYLGTLSKENVALKTPPADLARRFAVHSARALELAEEAVKAKPNDPAALYELGAIIGLQTAYKATVDGSVLGAVKAAHRAYNAHERVLELDPSRKDAGLIVGTYQYVTATLSWFMRALASLGGMGGDREGGIKMIEAAAAGNTEASPDAKFALILLYNREARYADAQRVIGDLQTTFGRNRLLWLEAGATALRAGRAADAETYLTTGMEKFAGDKRPRMFGEEALWLHKRGAARVALRRTAEAETDLRLALKLESRKWVAGRVHTELGKLADLKGERKMAIGHFKQAKKLTAEDNDAIGSAAAERWIGTAYKQ
jgi:tetratricopeptide (TPR) repeat protein